MNRALVYQIHVFKPDPVLLDTLISGYMPRKIFLLLTMIFLVGLSIAIVELP